MEQSDWLFSRVISPKIASLNHQCILTQKVLIVARFNEIQHSFALSVSFKPSQLELGLVFQRLIEFHDVSV